MWSSSRLHASMCTIQSVQHQERFARESEQNVRCPSPPEQWAPCCVMKALHEQVFSFGMGFGSNEAEGKSFVRHLKRMLGQERDQRTLHVVDPLYLLLLQQLGHLQREWIGVGYLQIVSPVRTWIGPLVY